MKSHGELSSAVVGVLYVLFLILSVIIYANQHACCIAHKHLSEGRGNVIAFLFYDQVLSFYTTVSLVV